MTEQILLKCESVTKSYQDNDQSVEVLSGVDLTISYGEQVAILGSSGSGKSTLLHILGTLDNPDSGQVSYQNINVHSLNDKQQAEFRNKQLGFIYQFHHLLPEFDALENVAMPLLIRGESGRVASVQAEELLNKVGLAHRLKHRPAQLSGGERQRVAIARALVTQPKLVLADEPTGNLDQQNSTAIYELLGELKTEFNTSFVVVTHDRSLAVRLDRIVELKQGKIA